MGIQEALGGTGVTLEDLSDEPNGGCLDRVPYVREVDEASRRVGLGDGLYNAPNLNTIGEEGGVVSVSKTVECFREPSEALLVLLRGLCHSWLLAPSLDP